MAECRVRPHTTSISELDDLRAVVARDLADASLDALSTDRRFATAYNAVLQIAKMVIACAGYRVAGEDTIELPLMLWNWRWDRV